MDELGLVAESVDRSATLPNGFHKTGLFQSFFWVAKSKEEETGRRAVMNRQETCEKVRKKRTPVRCSASGSNISRIASLLIFFDVIPLYFSKRLAVETLILHFLGGERVVEEVLEIRRISKTSTSTSERRS